MSNQDCSALESINGHLDRVFQGYVEGWAWNPLTPNEPVEVAIYINDQLDGTVKADQFRQDLLEAGLGNGVHAFRYSLKNNNLPSESWVSVRLSGDTLNILNSPMLLSDHDLQEHLTTLKIDPDNIAYSLEKLNSVRIDHLLIDPNDTCNADCVYCPNLRSKKRIEIEQFETLLHKCLKSVGTFQFGCGQEPTLDVRLPDFYKALYLSPLQPERITMITNATLLHRHDITLFREYGLSELQVSIDTVDPEVNAITRAGTDLERIMNNLKLFREKCPDLPLVFSVVVNALTINGIEALIQFGDSLDVTQYYLREVYDRLSPSALTRNNNYRDWIQKLSLKPGEMQQLQQGFKDHRSINKMIFIPVERLDSIHKETQRTKAFVRS